MVRFPLVAYIWLHLISNLFHLLNHPDNKDTGLTSFAEQDMAQIAPGTSMDTGLKEKEPTDVPVDFTINYEEEFGKFIKML